MIKISANISKKVPLPGIEFSSQQFGAAMEIEISDADAPEVIQARIQELYSMLSAAVDEQIGVPQGRAIAPTAAPQATAPRWQQPNRPPLTAPATNTPGNGYRHSTTNGNGNGAKGNGRKTTATQAQCRCIFALCKSLNLDLSAIAAEYHVADVSELGVRDASKLIDELKNRQAANQTAQ
ncbi:MAG TPA: hypothetical protein VGP72_05550 [Planctomycetota bacterium]|jgi:hypothetical protein